MYKISITIIITCYNLHEYLPACIESINAQTMQPTEVIVLHDDCESPVGVRGMINVISDRNKGVACMRNQGALLASSDHLLFVDADDCLDEHFIESMVKTKQETKADIIYPNVLLWSSWHKEVKLKNAWHESAEEITRKNMFDANQIVVSSLVPKKLYFQVDGTPNYPILEDYALWMECLRAKATFAKSAAAVLRYRQRQKSKLRSSDELKNEYYFRIKEQYKK